MAINTNLDFSEWSSVFEDVRMTTAPLHQLQPQGLTPAVTHFCIGADKR